MVNNDCLLLRIRLWSCNLQSQLIYKKCSWRKKIQHHNPRSIAKSEYFCNSRGAPIREKAITVNHEHQQQQPAKQPSTLSQFIPFINRRVFTLPTNTCGTVKMDPSVVEHPLSLFRYIWSFYLNSNSAIFHICRRNRI